MNDNDTEKTQLNAELTELRQQNAELNEKLSKYLNTHEILKKNMHNLGERVKELNCLYGISRLVEKAGISNEKLIQSIVELIPASWQYPEITCARVVIDYHEIRTKRFRETKWKQESEIFVNGQRYGSLEVFYMEERPDCDEGPFLKEERNLLNVIVERLGRIIERRKAEKQILQMRKELEVKAENLSETNAALKTLLKNQDSEKEKLENEIMFKIKTLVFPYLEKIQMSITDEFQKTYVKIIKKNLDEITKPFARQFKDFYTKLTPTEIKIAHLIMDNKTTNEIASLLNISDTTVTFHRKNIRIKLGLHKNKINLRSFLQSQMKK